MARAKKSKKLRVTYTKSAIGYTERQKATIRALGFRKLNQTVEHDDTPDIRGMVNRVSHLVTVEEV
ncbi:MAG: 50S ribosomal protein L30 [Chloroflexota bacterium]